MINPLISYLLKTKRLEKNLTIDEVAKKIEIDKTYLSKIENNKVIPIDRKLKQLYHAYNLKSYAINYIDFDENYINQFLNKIYMITVSDNDILDLDKKIQKHSNSIYLGHLCLLQWCYKSLKGFWDERFLSDTKSFINSINLFTKEEQTFFLLCLMFYFLRNKQFDQYNKYYEILNQIQDHEWLGLEYYIKTNYDHYKINHIDMAHDIKLAKKYLKEDKNIKRFNSTLQYEAIYYDLIKDYNRELQIYNQLLEIYKNRNQLEDYGITNQNIGSMLLNEKKYAEAIPYYVKGSKYNSLNGPYFELAWCYYNVGDLKQCKETIKAGKNTDRVIPYYNDFLDWLDKMITNPYSKSCLNLLLKIESNYEGKLSHEIQQTLYILIANTYIKLDQPMNAYQYLKKIVNKDLSLPVEAI